MNFSKIIFSTLIFAFFIFNGNLSAQINVASDGSVGMGTTATGSTQLRVYNTEKAWAGQFQSYTTGNGSTMGLQSYIEDGSLGYKAGMVINVYQNAASIDATRGLYSFLYSRGTGDGYGLTSHIIDEGTGTNYGIYSVCYSGYAGYFSGNLHVTGSLTSFAPTNNPTAKIAGCANAINRINALDAISIQTTDNKTPKTQYSLDMVSLKQTFPELVHAVKQPGDFDEEGNIIEGSEKGTRDAIDYNSFIPVLIQAIQEQQAEIDLLQKKLESLTH